MFYFSEDGRNLQVEYYSTDRKAYFLEENQFTVTLDLVDAKTEETTAEPEESECGLTEETTAEVIETEAPAIETQLAGEKSGCGGVVSLAIVPLIFIAIPVLGKKRSGQ